MRSGKLLSVAVVLAVLLCGSVFAQNNPNIDQGLKPYDSWHGGDLDSVSLTNGGLVLHVPLASFPQRGNLDLSFMVRFSRVPQASVAFLSLTRRAGALSFALLVFAKGGTR